jgi:O-antigen chain-terminating methyltransferase
MQEDDVTIGADVDVRALMADVRAAVARRREEGLYPPDIMQEFDVVSGLDGRDDALQNALMGLRQTAGFSTAVTTASQIPVVAPIATSFKRAVRSSVRWYMTGIMQQVEAFGANVIHAIGLIAERLRGLEERSLDRDGLREEISQIFSEEAADLRAGMDSARDATESLSRRLDELEAEVGGSRPRDRLALVERSLRSLREQVDTGASPEVKTVPRVRSWQVESALDYFDFENQFRGSEESIRARQSTYVDEFRAVPGPVVDLGCGRGEFLELLSAAGIEAYGVDRHPDMVARCVEKGLDARQGEALEHLSSVEPGRLGGIFSAQMIEHLEIRDVPGVFELSADALAPGGRLVIETINPESLIVFASAFYVDLGHLRPLHPLTLRFLAEKTGFRDVRVEYFSPPPEEARPAEVPATGHAPLDQVVEAVNENFRRVDQLVFGPQDYAVIATR